VNRKSGSNESWHWSKILFTNLQIYPNTSPKFQPKSPNALLNFCSHPDLRIVKNHKVVKTKRERSTKPGQTSRTFPCLQPTPNPQNNGQVSTNRVAPRANQVNGCYKAQTFPHPPAQAPLEVKPSLLGTIGQVGSFFLHPRSIAPSGPVTGRQSNMLRTSEACSISSLVRTVIPDPNVPVAIRW
jgi:hypothetical protein